MTTRSPSSPRTRVGVRVNATTRGSCLGAGPRSFVGGTTGAGGAAPGGATSPGEPAPGVGSAGGTPGSPGTDATCSPVGAPPLSGRTKALKTSHDPTAIRTNAAAAITVRRPARTEAKDD